MAHRPISPPILRSMLLAASMLSGSAYADVPFSTESVAAGRALFMSNCTQCHGNDGKAQVDVISNATDLTEPELYRNGTTDADITRSIREGVGGVMPPWGAVFKSEADIDHLKNFIKNLWPADQRPTAE